MQTIIPLEAWTKLEPPFASWMPVAMGGTFGVLFVLYELTPAGTEILSSAVLLRSSLNGLLMGLMLGVISSISEYNARERARRPDAEQVAMRLESCLAALAHAPC